MTVTQLQFGADARRRMANGAATLARAAMATLGPRGRNVLIYRPFGTPAMTKDDVSVAMKIKRGGSSNEKANFSITDDNYGAAR